MFKYTPFIKLNFGFVCVRVGVQKGSIYSLTVSYFTTSFLQFQHQFQPFLLVLLLKTEHKLVLVWVLGVFVYVKTEKISYYTNYLNLINNNLLIFKQKKSLN